MRFCLGAFLSLFFLAFGWVAQGPENIRFETDVGPATLKHRGHQKRLGGDCSVCHHQVEEGEEKSCGECHRGRVEAAGGEEGAPSYFDVKTKLCRGCHLENRERDNASKAPVHCEECHDIRAKAKEQGTELRPSPATRRKGKGERRKGWIE